MDATTAQRRDMKAKQLFLWAKDLTPTAIYKVRYENGDIGVVPGCLKTILYSEDSDDIVRAYALLEANIKRVGLNEPPLCGGSYDKFTFFTKEGSYSVKVVNGLLDGGQYRLADYSPYGALRNPNCRAFGLIGYGLGQTRVRRMSDGEKSTVDHVLEMEFVRIDAIEGLEPKYLVEGFIGPMFVYGPDIIAYQQEFYRVIGEHNFEALFA